jgi:hypothetical protein
MLPENISILREYEDYAGNQKLDFLGLYEKYPEFGQYEGIIQLERSVLNDIIF